MNTKGFGPIAGMIALACLSGCREVRQDLKQAQQQIKSTRRSTMEQIQKIRQHGAIDLEVQQLFAAIAAAYQAGLDKNGVGPADWNELVQLAASPILIQDAMQRNATIAFGLSAEQFRADELRAKPLILMPDVSGSGGWAMEVGGAMRQLGPVEFESATLANQ
jgi:hypothetical protein